MERFSYTVRDEFAIRGQRKTWTVARSKVLDFGAAKSVRSGDRVFALYKLPDGGASTCFYTATVQGVSKVGLLIEDGSNSNGDWLGRRRSFVRRG